MNEIVYININKDEFVNSSRPLYKHMSLNNALRTLNKHFIWFSNPTEWKDPFEGRFLTAKYHRGNEILDFPWVNRVYCTCVTLTASSEAFWTPYSQNQIAIELRINRQQLITELESYLDKYDIYVGKVNYQQTDVITGELHTIPFTTNILQPFSEMWCAELLLLKRNAYKYEDEVRIIMVEKQKKIKSDTDSIMTKPNVKKGIKVGFKCKNTDIIKDIILDPSLERDTEMMLKNVFEEIYDFKPISNSAKAHRRVMKSGLYTKQKPKDLKLR